MTTSNALTRVPENVDIDTTIRGKIIVTANGEDWVLDMEPFGITVDSSNSEIMDSISAAVKEQLGRIFLSILKLRKLLIPEIFTCTLHQLQGFQRCFHRCQMMPG